MNSFNCQKTCSTHEISCENFNENVGDETKQTNNNKKHKRILNNNNVKQPEAT